MPLNVTATFAPAPSTERAKPIHITCDKNRKKFAYGAGLAVVIRNIDDPTTSLVCSRHAHPVTCARISPEGNMCASGDRDGNVLIWNAGGDMVVKHTTKAISGQINDIAWSHDQQRMVVVGDGKTSFGSVFFVEGGNTVGTIAGHQKPIMSCDFRKDRPFRIATGGSDTKVGWFEGPPFKFIHSVTDSFQANVSCVRFSPSNEFVAAISGSDTILLLDGREGKVSKTIKTEHTGTILNVAWSPTSEFVAVASADKSVSMWSVSTGTKVAAHSFGKAIPDMQQGLFFTESAVASVSFSGDINWLQPDTMEVTSVWRGHGKPIASVHHVPSTDMFVTSSTDGVVLQWKGVSSQAHRVEGTGLTTINAVALLDDGSSVAVGASETAVISAGGEASKLSLELKGSQIGAAGLAGNAVAIATSSAIVILSGGKKIAEESVTYDIASLGSNGDNEIVVGCKDNAARVFTFEGGALKLKSELKGKHNGAVTAATMARGKNIVATGDTTRLIFVWDSASGEVLFDDLVFHNSRINALSFNPSASLMVSGSVDSSIIVWDLANKKRQMQENAHKSGVNAVSFFEEGKFVSGGHDGFIRVWTL